MENQDIRFDATHASILKAGQKLFQEKGYAATSLRDVMGAVGMTIGGFYAHFGSKAELFEACFRNAGETGSARIFAGTGEGRFQDAVARYLSPKHVASKGEGCPLAALASDLDQYLKINPVPLADEHLARFRAGLTACGADDGQCLALIAMLLGALTLARTVTDPMLRESLLAQTLSAAARFRDPANQGEKS